MREKETAPAPIDPAPRPRRDRRWAHDAIQAIHADMTRSAETHLLRFPLPRAFRNHGLYLKDESTHPTGSLKHRLACSLFLYALCNENIVSPRTPVYEASSGSTAISEAYFAQLIGLEQFHAVVPESTSEPKKKLIRDYGGRIVPAQGDIVAEARRLAAADGGYFMDQFTYSERATDWRGNNNIAETIYDQMAREPLAFRVPSWIVCGAGTGGTSATVGRFARLRGHDTRLCVVDPEGSCYLDRWRAHRGLPAAPRPGGYRTSSIEGIGRPFPAESFLPGVVDAMVAVPDDASVGAMRYLHDTGRHYCGPSSGANLIGAIAALEAMRQEGAGGSVVTLLCDSGLRYSETYYNADHLMSRTLPDGSGAFDVEEIERYRELLHCFFSDGCPAGLTDPAFQMTLP